MANLFKNDLHDLNQHGNDQNEGDGLHELQMERNQQQRFDHVGEERGDGHNEGDGHAHSQRRLRFFGDAQERADAKELGHHEVVDQNAANDDQ